MITEAQWTIFFEQLAETGIVKRAAAAAGMDRTIVYDRIHHGKAEGATEEQKAWLARFERAQLQSIDTLESEAFRRAVEGTEEPLIGRVARDEDGVITHVRKYSDTLLNLLLRARDPQRFKDRSAHELTGKDGGPIQQETKVIAVPAIDETQPE